MKLSESQKVNGAEHHDARMTGILEALLMKRLRVQIEALAYASSIEVLFLKGAWSEPVLHGGSGQRRVTDVDILVRPRDFLTMADALPALGYARALTPFLEAREVLFKEFLFRSLQGDGLPIDLHRHITGFPLPYALNVEGLFERAVSYDSADGPIRSLSPEDQLCHAALHYANSDFILDDRHLNDMRLLVEKYPVRWPMVIELSRKGGFEVPMAWLAWGLGQRPPGLAVLTSRQERLIGAIQRHARREKSKMKVLYGVAQHSVVAGRFTHPLKAVIRYAPLLMRDKLAMLRQRG